MGFVSPDYGTIFWMIIIFGASAFILKKFAWKPLLNALKARENSISEALSSAKKARREVEDLKAANEKIIAEARAEKDTILRNAIEIKDKILAEAKNQAETEGQKIILAFRRQIEIEKIKAVEEMKAQVTELSIQIAEKILRKELERTQDQEELVKTILKDLKVQ